MTDLELAATAARRAGGILRKAFGTELEVQYKSTDQPVTEADHKADRFLRESLLRARPDYGWISEESDRSDTALDAPTWVVDPLDGTWNFIEGRPEFAVCIGLLVRGTPGLGVVYNPISDVLYSATRGGGAFRDSRPVRAREFPETRPLLVASVQELERKELERLREVCDVETLGSTALKIARVAEGGADLYISRTRKGIWDVCAAAAIAAEAGATVASAGGEPLDFATPSATVDGLIVAGTGAERDFPRLVELLRVDDGHPEKEN